MLDVRTVDALMSGRDAFLHVRSNFPDAACPVVKLLPQTTGGVDIQMPNGKREHFDTAEAVASRVSAILSERKSGRTPLIPKRKQYNPRHMGGLHVLFTTDENQCLVVWRLRDPDTHELRCVSGTIWAAVEEGEIGGYDLSKRQVKWLDEMRKIANDWTMELAARGLNANTGGTPTKTPRGYDIPVRTGRLTKWIFVKPE
jgi:hypothetical protein